MFLKGRVRVPAALALVATAVGVLGVGTASARPGAPDRSFGDGGVVAVQRPPAKEPVWELEEVEPGPNGLVYALSNGSDCESGVCSLGAYVSRYQSDGSLDSSFGQQAHARPFYEVRSRAPISFAVDPQGGVFVAVGEEGGTKVVHLDALGRLDPAFGTRTFPCACRAEEPVDLELGPEGRLTLAAGYPMTFTRFTEAGALDPQFGAGAKPGVAIWSPWTIRADGAIVALGAAEPEARGPIQLILIGNDGEVSDYGHPLSTSRFEGVWDLASFGNGDIVAVGPGGERSTGYVARLRPNGRFKRSFGHKGVLRFRALAPTGASVDPRGRTVLFGVRGAEYISVGEGAAEPALRRASPRGRVEHGFEDGIRGREIGGELMLSGSKPLLAQYGGTYLSCRSFCPVLPHLYMFRGGSAKKAKRGGKA